MSKGDATRFPTWRTTARHLAQAALGTERRRRLRTGRSVLAVGVYLVCATLELVGAAGGICDPRAAPWLAAGMLIGPAVFYAAMRSGWSERFADPSLTLPQTLCAICTLTIAYPVSGEVRGAHLMLVALMPVFAISALTPRQIIGWLGGASVLSFGTMMFTLAWLWPERFDPRIEAMHFLIAALSLPIVALMASQVSGLRKHLIHQQDALKTALTKIEMLANHDELTGLCNRSHMIERLTQEARRSLRQGAPFCIGLIDLDHFKQVNDRHGHAAGDLVLSRFAKIAVETVREIDVIARWGGEEFLLMLPATSLPAAERVLARLHDAVRTAGADDLAPRVSFSAGIALHLPANDIEATIAMADAALYRAKAAGRDRVMLATPEVVSAPAPGGQRAGLA